ncbi:formate dehydrogenase accessory sulfurtransferase FdhD [Modicisalibacter luteus]|uniref:Formate dehydrogenase accessory sulfurtransferase FdhD n=1 Tax=Modicisalibacter luteus TaxID=453962 RepID=A0ABV7M0Z5_9GAMM|nr:formate dehydrogenase accessory sulfurtransferase FdhD [Halomonas lutea]GHA96419.1 sulfurtransferase FdhD [Halomonas lutea]
MSLGSSPPIIESAASDEEAARLCYEDQRQRPLREFEGPSELPITLILNDTAMATLLATPESLEALAIGHAYTAGWIERYEQIERLERSRLRHGLAIRMTVPPRLAAQAAEHAPREASVSSCGACGAAEEAQIMAGLVRLRTVPPLSPVALQRGLALLKDHSRRGQHCALGLDDSGEVMSVGVDIGRHNALDRVIGDSLRSGEWPRAVLLSSRCSLELVQKTVRAGITTLATLSSPSAMAVEVARACDLNLICCHRGSRLELLSGQAPD